MRQWLTLIVMILALAGCDFLADGQVSPSATPTAGLPVADATRDLPMTPEAPATLPPAQTTITLTVWTTPDIAPRTELAGGPTLLEQFNAFDQNQQDVEIFVELKTVSDQGGTLSYLRSGRTVAPSVLPDVVLLPTGQMRDAAAEGLIYPLDSLLDQEMMDDLFPVAREAVSVNESAYGYPIALSGLKHLVYNRNVITDTLPTDWAGFSARGEENSLIFPASGPLGAEWTLQLYLAAGGQLQTDGSQPLLEVEPLTTALQAINRATTSNLIDPQSANTATVQQAWQIFQNTPADIAEVTAAQFLSAQIEGTGAVYGFIPLPGPDGPLSPLLTGWAWAISTPDPARQAIAAELLGWLGAGPNLGEWTVESQMLPARRAAFASWPGDDPYVTFLQEQLEAARPIPPGVNNATLLALTSATNDVVLQLNSPEAAAAEAVSELEAP